MIPLTADALVGAMAVTTMFTRAAVLILEDVPVLYARFINLPWNPEGSETTCKPGPRDVDVLAGWYAPGRRNINLEP